MRNSGGAKMANRLNTNYLPLTKLTDFATSNVVVNSLLNIPESNQNGFLQIPSGTTGQRPETPANGYIRYNVQTGYGEIYNGVIGQWLSFGTSPVLDVEYLVVAGGGGGAGYIGGGGGAGGLRAGTLQVQTATSYTLTVGAGGNAGVGGNPGADGSASQFNTIISAGGAKGAASGVAGFPGGSGSGAGGTGGGNNPGGSGNVPPTSPPQGNPGSLNFGQPGVGAAGGGGGAGTAAVNASGGKGGNGGNGANSTISGNLVTYAGGGGGGIIGNTVGFGGPGGGGSGSSGPGAATSGTTNLGGGGGGGGNAASTSSGGNGGSGIVILKYLNLYTANFAAGLTANTIPSGSYKISTVTAGTGSVTFSVG